MRCCNLTRHTPVKTTTSWIPLSAQHNVSPFLKQRTVAAAAGCRQQLCTCSLLLHSELAVELHPRRPPLPTPHLPSSTGCFRWRNESTPRCVGHLLSLAISDLFSCHPVAAVRKRAYYTRSEVLRAGHVSYVFGVFCPRRDCSYRVGFWARK